MRGLVVAPGFIDVHTHADDIARTPDAANFTRMGVTTIVAGNCGSSALDGSRLMPPLNVGDDVVDAFLGALPGILDEAGTAGGEGRSGE